MADVDLTGLIGTNPLGFLAALGALDVTTRRLPDTRLTLAWTDGLEPTARLTGPDSLDHLIDLCDTDRQRWADSLILTWGPGKQPMADLKPDPETELIPWLNAILAAMTPDDRRDVDLIAALLSEGALAGKGVSKPTHLHFTAGKQLFLVMARALQEDLKPADLREAFTGPWRYASTLPILRWDPSGERVYAHTSRAPESTKATGVPGADWLAFVGLRHFPVTTGGAALLTTGCSPEWKRGEFRWPLWNAPATSRVIMSLLAHPDLTKMTQPQRELFSVHRLLAAPIRRTDQGGYGSFGAPTDLPPAPTHTALATSPTP
ncbi:hypothetical protein [Pseudofrankia asymbiotica]|uniref:Uncharacterized protein n=1 Tax=Pseudofrankia asymbiotica TaxID=1834516 RepID=A0A1V2HZI8_9ACTN|nr:hypothetical protein [Pseudofrankia asymbiotica]ONH21978.1 hypothetical protein BL253_37125 [Pseudofrankia asymbiotica]